MLNDHRSGICRCIRLATVSLLAPLFGGVAYSATYYVDFSAGSDSNAGTSTGAAFQHSPGDATATATAAATALHSGDEVIFKGGVTYLGDTITCVSGVTYDGNSAGSFGSGEATISGSTWRGQSTTAHLAAFTATSLTGITFNKLIITQWGGHGSTSWVGTGDAIYPGQGIFLDKCSNCSITNCSISDIGDWQNVAYVDGNNFAGSTGQDACAVGIFDQASNITISGCDFTEMHTPIAIQPKNGTAVIQNVSILNNSIHDYVVWGIDLACNGANCTLNAINIQGNTFTGTWEYGSTIWQGVENIAGTFGGTSGSGGATQFQLGETVTQASTNASGVFSGYQTGNGYNGELLLSNMSGSADSSHAWTGGTSGGTFTPSAVPHPNNPHQDMVIMRIADNPPATGQTLGTPANPIAISGNTFYNNYSGPSNGGTAGIFMTTFGGTVLIDNNTFVNMVSDGEGSIYCQDGPGVGNPAPDYWFVSNSFYDAVAGIILRTQSGTNYGLTTGGNPGDVHVLNNIFYKTNSDANYMLQFGLSSDPDSNPTQLDYDVYQTGRSDGLIAEAWTGSASAGETLSGLQGLGYETHGAVVSETTPQYANVSFGLGTSASSNNLHLASGSVVAATSGFNLTSFDSGLAITTDKDGSARPATGAWSSGAYDTPSATSTSFNIIPLTFTYNGSAQGPTITPTPSNATYSTSGTPTATSVGSYSVTATATGSYSGTSGPVSWSITKATPTITTVPTASGITYGQTLASSSLSGGGGSVSGSFAFTTPSTAPAAGSPPESVTFTPTDTTDYNTITTSVSVAVGKATPSITTAPTASGITYGETLADSNLSGGAGSVDGSFAFTTPSTAPSTGATAEGVTFTPADTTDYNTATTSVNVTVGKATPSINTAPTASAITSGQMLSSSTLSGGSASTGGSFAFTSPSTTPAAGAQSESVTFTPTDTTDYNTATTTVIVMVNSGGGTAPATQTISFQAPAQLIVGVPATVSATASSGLTPVTVTLAAGTNNAVLTQNSPNSANYTVVASGGTSVTLEAGQAGDGSYDSANGSVTLPVVSDLEAFGRISGGTTDAVASRFVTSDATTQSNIAAFIDATAGTGTLVGYLPSIQAGFDLSFTLKNGSFTAQTNTLVGTGSTSRTLTFTGTLSGSALSGTIQELGLTYSATVDTGGGSSASVSGLYGSGSTYAVVGSQGEVFVLVVTPTLVDGGSGTVGSNDSFTLQTTQGATISADLSASSGLTGSLSLPGGGTTPISGSNNTATNPTITPASPNVAAGATVVLTASATGATGYQWQHQGSNISGATGSTLTLANVGGYQAGLYTVTVTTSGGSAVSAPVSLVVNVNSRIINLSARAYVGTGADTLAAGFVINGSSTKEVLLRGVGPTLGSFDVTGALSDPVLTLFDSVPTVIATNTGWSNASVRGASTVNATIAPATSSLFNQVFAFSLPSGSADSAMAASLPAGLYSTMVSGVDNGTGIALAEIYDADTGTPTDHLVNISARAYAAPGQQALAAGFVISGPSSQTVLIRGIGPTLSSFGLTGVLATPQLTLFDSTSTAIATNTGWGNALVAGSSTVSAGLQTATAALMSQVGAFSLSAGSADSAMVATLPPGTYTVQVTGEGSDTGIALIEVYDLP